MLGKGTRAPASGSVLIPPADDAAGLAIAYGLESSIRGIAAGIRISTMGSPFLAVPKVGCLRK